MLSDMMHAGGTQFHPQSSLVEITFKTYFRFNFQFTEKDRQRRKSDHKKDTNIKHQTFYSTAGLLCSTVDAMKKKKKVVCSKLKCI